MGLAKNLLPVAARLLALKIWFLPSDCFSNCFGVGIACLRKPAAPLKFLNPLAALSPPPLVYGIIGGIRFLVLVKFLGVCEGVNIGSIIGLIIGISSGNVTVSISVIVGKSILGILGAGVIGIGL